MVNLGSLAAVLAVAAPLASAVNFAVPAQYGASGFTYAHLDSAPVAVS